LTRLAGGHAARLCLIDWNTKGLDEDRKDEFAKARKKFRADVADDSLRSKSSRRSPIRSCAFAIRQSAGCRQ
jgi:hypothetical protein